MATLFNIKASDADKLTRLINGIIVSKRGLVVGRDQSPSPAAAPNNLYKHPVSGLTLEFTTPLATVTFSGDLDFKEIVAEINTQAGADVAHMYKFDDNGQQILVLWNDTTPVVLGEAGTANPYFGFSTDAGDADLVQNPIDPADITAIVVEPLSRKYVCFYAV